MSLAAPYNHLALREVVKTWQVRLDGQGHLKLAHDADTAREESIGPVQNHNPVSSSFLLLAKGHQQVLLS